MDRRSENYQSPIALFSHESKIHHCLASVDFPKGRFRYGRVKESWLIHDLIEFSYNDLRFLLDEFHFHAPAEHYLDDTRGLLELHLVFRSGDAYYLVIAFPIYPGKETSSFLQEILRGRPCKIPTINQFWTYSGGLTSPPLNRAVNWLVCLPLFITRNDYEILKKMSKTGRGIQPRQGRNIAFVTCK
jgi:carbonic anhydrase